MASVPSFARQFNGARDRKFPIVLAVEQIRRVFEDNFAYFSIKTYVVGTLMHNICKGDCNEYPQHMFLWRTDKNYPSIIIKYPPYLFHCLVLCAGLPEYPFHMDNPSFLFNAIKLSSNNKNWGRTKLML